MPRKRKKPNPFRHIKKVKGTDFKSSLELKVAEICLTECDYEPKSAKLNYTVPHVYNPDFVHRLQPDIIFEVKGYFQKGAVDASKYIAIVRDNPQIELVFIFSDPSKKAYSGCKIRKDGSYMSLGEWCLKHGILYWTPDDLPDPLRRGEWSLEYLRSIKSELLAAKEV